MPTPCYISITGQTQGNIIAGAFTADSGNIYVQGHEDEMLVQILVSVTVPTDPPVRPACGSACSQAVHFYRGAEQSCPLMYNALASGEMLPTTELHWWRTSVEGKQEHYFTTRLTDSTIVDMKLHMPHCQDPAKREFTQLLEVSLAYRKIEWEHVKSGTSGADGLARTAGSMS
ncbi:Hcp family type VI secretion system effector [Escherichia coli]